MESEQAPSSEIWNLIAPVVEREGFRVFDIELPQSASGILKVFIWKGKGEGVLLDDCARISRGLDELTQLDDAIAGSYVLEVSSPGINRKLIRPEHFAEAIGERVKVIVDHAEFPGGVVRGILQAFDGNSLKILDEELEEPVNLKFSALKKANVEFKFDN